EPYDTSGQKTKKSFVVPIPGQTEIADASIREISKRMPAADFSSVPVVDDVVVARLLALRDQVAKPGEDVLGELLTLFERDPATRIDALKAAIAAGDLEAKKNAAHALKGAAGNIGAQRVAAWAAHVEKAPIGAEMAKDVERLSAEVQVASVAL